MLCDNENEQPCSRDVSACSSTSTTSAETIQMTSNEITNDLKAMKEQKVALKIQLKKKLLDEENQLRKEKATKAMNYLLKHSQKYSTLFLDKLQNNNHLITSTSSTLKVKKRDESFDKKKSIIQPKYFTGTLYPYQLEGLSWLKILFENSINGILADEMGLGKTIQVIALIAALIENKVKGPYLIVAPLSTIPNWISEFKKFAPKIPVVLFYGNAGERYEIYSEIKKTTYNIDGFQTPPVVITTYQVPLIEGKFLRTLKWQYLVIDEGHRIKNSECKLYHELQLLNTQNRLLLTGTPLQNNLTELWALLHFLMPQFFENMDTFGNLFEVEDFNESVKILQQEKETHIISTIHGVLDPFMLRRLKSDVLNMVPKKEVLVYCPLSELQTDLYRYVLQKNISKLTGKDDEEEDDKENIVQERKRRRKCVKKTSYYYPLEDDDFTEESEDVFSSDLPSTIQMSDTDKKQLHRVIKLTNPMMMMRKIINHPFTVHCPIAPDTGEVLISNDIITQSGKMMVLDAMLCKLKERGHKVLIFCTFTLVLDFIEDYINIRKYGYCRLDGNSKFEKRQKDINDFNTKPEVFAFLISTRAGGLGLNLIAADTVILFDRDWNPQTDLQAQDRCHRIGQTKPVAVYTLISKGTIDEYILRRATAKRRLEKIVMKKGQFAKNKQSDNPNNIIKSSNDLKELEELLNSVDHEQIIQPNGFVLSDEELTKLLDRSDLYKEFDIKDVKKVK